VKFATPTLQATGATQFFRITRYSTEVLNVQNHDVVLQKIC